MMTWISRWFSQATASKDYRSSDYLVLWLILAAGVVLRFWGLGNIGLHGDEETMAMPAMAILDTGHPHLPSGMYYARALLNIYLMSGSVWLFGESEWAFRLPSVIVGSFAGLAAFFMGRRFLSPQLNLAFVATITLLPGMIEVSQTARMYVFLVTCLIWFGACLFRWERDQRISSLMLALLVWVLSLHFHTLAIFAAPLFLFPGLSRRSWTQFIQGGAAFLAGGLLFRLYGRWISSKYPQDEERPPPLEEGSTQSAIEALLSGNKWLAVAIVLTVVALAILLLVKSVRRGGWVQMAPVLLVVSALLSMAVLHYHLGGILLMLGVVFWLRDRALPRSWLIAAMLLAAVMGGFHLGVLHNTGLYPGRKVIGAIVGTPSVWPTLRFLEYSPFAGIVYGGVFLFALCRFANGRPLPMHVLFFAMAVWAPLLILGYFAWWVPPRYAIGQVGFFLMCTVAGLAYVARERNWIADGSRLSGPKLALLAVVTTILINPIEFGRTVNPDYTNHPDHKGAAEYIKNLDLNPDAILIAEDILQQTYYLGSVDYYLREIDRAHGYAVVQDGRLVDQYTATEVLGTGAELEAVLDAGGERDVYVIGSGENFLEGERLFRGRGIAEVLESERLEVVYTGRDAKTKIWKLVR
jgi:4-amino-4-deoxy-L-arabinose transferase-like glycosyltransferase